MKSKLKIFLFVLIINFIFSQVIGDDNINRVFYSIAIANGTLFLDEFDDFVGDLTTWNGHSISTKSPGISFLLSPISFVLKNALSKSEIASSIRESLHYRKLIPMELPPLIAYLLLIAIFTFSTLPGALITLVIFKYTKNVYLSIFLYFSSLLFPYSTTLFSYTLSIFLIIFAFVRKHKVLSPLLLGLSVLIEFTSIFLALINLYFLRKKVKVRYFFVGILPAFIYFLIFSSVTFYLLQLTSIFHLYASPSFESFSINKSLFLGELFQFLTNILLLLFSPYRGIFLYFPLIFVFIIYFKVLKAEEKNIAMLSLLAYLFFNSLLGYWWGSLSFGPRHMIYCVPFVILSISSNWKKMNRKILYSFIFFSIPLTFSSFTYWEGAKKIKISGKDLYLTGIYKVGEIVFENERELAFSPLIYEHYLISLIENGPRSKLLESLFTERPLDLRYLLPDDRDFITFIYPYPPYLSLLILILLCLIFFWSELKRKKIPLFLLFALAITILFYNLHHFGIFDSFRKVSGIRLKFGFYPRDSAGNLLAHKKAVAYIFSDEDREKIISLIFRSFHEDRKVILLLNGNKLKELNVSKDYDTLVSFPSYLKRGKNTLEIISDKCLRPIELNLSNDKRCLSLFFESIETFDIDRVQVVFSEGWYLREREDDYQWGSDFVKILYISPENSTVTFFFDILPIFNETTVVHFYLNGELKNVFEIAKGGGWVYTLPQRVIKGVNYLEFKVPRGCIVIDEILHNGDKRCIAMTIREIKVRE